MSTLIITLTILTIAAGIATVALELARDLMMFQQNSYRPERYRRWLRTSGDTTSVMRLVLILFGMILLWQRNSGGWWWIEFALLFTFGFDCYRLATRRYKKPLVMTHRAWRLMTTMTVIEMALIAANILVFWPDFWFGAVLALIEAYILSHVILLFAAWLLKPVEKNINRKYYKDAQRILESMPDLKIIGITGSYGKTSTKHYLQRILSEKYDTLMTPGSFNTTMGVIRTVREHLKPYNEVFIVEMGAKQPGDIKEICDLVHPTMGIITAVGEQHLESFRTIEGVQKTKFELADALPDDGLVVVNDDFEYVANRNVDNVKCIRYAVKATKNARVTVKDVQYDATGTSFTVMSDDDKNALTLHTKLVGECNISNLIAAVTIARELGVPDDKIRYAVEKIDQVEHRLNIKHTPAGITIIDDAFNSNPTGSAMALDVLASMKGGKRIVVTPGMIELGDKQKELNRDFGKKIAESADVAIIVGNYNREAIMEGIKESNKMQSDNVHCVDTFNQAQQLLSTLASRGDTVLYENDLPDTFK